jgi:hypothetical protein
MAPRSGGTVVDNGITIELAHQGTLVVAVHASFIDTDMAAGIDGPKISPESVARQAFDAVETGEIECRQTSGPVRQGIAVARSRLDLPACPGALGRRGEGHPLAPGSSRSVPAAAVAEDQSSTRPRDATAAHRREAVYVPTS